jgi:uracil DNA glycosylase
MSTKLEWSKWESQFGTWAAKIKPFFDSGEFDDIYGKLREESGRGHQIAPVSDLTYRTFQLTPIDNIKCVVLGMC